MDSYKIDFDDNLISASEFKSLLNALPGIIAINDTPTNTKNKFVNSKYSILDILLNGLTIMSSVRDQNGKIIDFRYEFINEAGCKLNMTPREEFENKTLLEFLPAHKESGLFDIYCNIVETGEDYEAESLDFEDYYDGKKLKRAFDIKASKFGDGFIATWRDITIKKQNELLLKEKFEFIETITKNSPDVIYIYDIISQKNLFSTDNLGTLAGYTPNEVLALGENFLFKLIHPDDIPHSIVHFKKISEAADDIVLENEYRMLHKSGVYKWMRSRNKVYRRNPDGKVEQIIGIAYDVTETKLLEDKILQRDKLINKFFDNSVDGFLLIQSYTGIIEDCNKSMIKIFKGEEISQFVGKPISSFHKDLVKDSETIKSMKKSLTDEGYWSGIFEYKRIDDSTFWGNLTIVEFKDEDKLIHFATIKDISVSKAYQEKLEILTDELQSNLALREKFIKIIAHDIRSPFHSIMGLTDIVLDDFDTFNKDEIKQYLLKIHISQNKLYSFVNSLLEWAVLQSGQFKVKIETFEICSLIKNIIELLEWDFKAKDIKIIFNENGLCSKINSDLNAVKSIIINLLNNAIKFSYRNSQIEIAFSEIDRALKVSVIDLGPGITESEMKRILDSKDSYSTKGTENETGTGLGLAFCIEMAEKLGLKLEIESTPGVGTSVSVIFPEEYLVKK